MTTERERNTENLEPEPRPVHDLGTEPPNDKGPPKDPSSTDRGHTSTGGSAATGERGEGHGQWGLGTASTTKPRTVATVRASHCEVIDDFCVKCCVNPTTQHWCCRYCHYRQVMGLNTWFCQ